MNNKTITNRTEYDMKTIRYPKLSSASIDRYLCYWEVEQGAISDAELNALDAELEDLNALSTNPADYPIGSAMWTLLRADSLRDQARVINNVANNTAMIDEDEYTTLVEYLIQTNRNGLLEALCGDQRTQRYILKALNRELAPSRAMKEILRLKTMKYAELLRARHLLGYDAYSGIHKNRV